MRNLLAMLWNEWKDLELQIEEMNDEVERIASSDAACLRLRQSVWSDRRRCADRGLGCEFV